MLFATLLLPVVADNQRYLFYMEYSTGIEPDQRFRKPTFYPLNYGEPVVALAKVM